MLIVALVFAVIGLAALITAVVTSNEVVAWVCIGASGLGILTLVVDAIRERSRTVLPAVAADPSAVETTEVIEPAQSIEPVGAIEFIETAEEDLDVADAETHYDTEVSAATQYDTEVSAQASPIAAEDHPDELVYDEPDYDLPSDDEAEFPEPAEEAAIHVVTEESIEDDGATDLIVIDDAFEQSDESDATEAFIIDTAEEGPDADAETAATEIRYVVSAEGSADTVYTYSEGTEYIEAQDPEATDEPRGH
jgi:hypothetical protein